MPDEPRDEDTGRYTEQFSDADILDLVSQQEPIGTGDVAEAFDCSIQAAYKRLRALEMSDELTSQMIGGNRVWMCRD